MMKKGNCIVGQSGGPTCVINASLYGIIKEAQKHCEIEKVYGCINGINGVINDNLVEFDYQNLKELELLKQTPSAILGSVRYCLNEDFEHEDYLKILNIFKKYQIKYFFYIGGNDSMDTVLKLSKFFKKINYECFVMGVPKTIDNDLVLTDHTPGYGSAARFIANSIIQIKQDINCYKEGRVTIVEIMGRDAGWLTAACKLACSNNEGADLIYLPEVPFDLNKFILKVEELYLKNRKVLVCVSEGIKDKNGKHIVNEFAYANDNDVFGHLQLGGVSSVLAHKIKEKLDLPVRAIELNLLQRCFSILASKNDIMEAIQCAKIAVRYALKKESGKMVCINRNTNNNKTSFQTIDIDKIANQTKYFPTEWIIDGCDISNQYLQYALPLISPNYPIQYQNGLIQCASLKKLIK